jgi:hypothetical protein
MQKQNTKLQAVSTHPTATLDLSVKGEWASQQEVNEWEIDGAIYAAMLSHRDCPQSFREAFTTIFTEHLLSECEAAHPHWIRHFFPLVVLSMQGSIPVDALRVVEVLRTLRETLAPALTKEIQDAMEL